MMNGVDHLAYQMPLLTEKIATNEHLWLYYEVLYQSSTLMLLFLSFPLYFVSCSSVTLPLTIQFLQCSFSKAIHNTYKFLHSLSIQFFVISSHSTV